ncbi:MAG TPA: ATP synthase F1 subunit delta [Chitinispirillaceae bacterium]|nr:ATP synthase F1 subunit delta [Chitinispirillaceae bacterium]
MIDSTVSRHYAAALFDLVSQQNLLPLVEADLKTIENCIIDDPNVFRQLSLPSISGTVRCSIIEKAFTGTMHPVSLNFLKVVSRNNRLHELQEIIFAFNTLVKDSKKISNATVESACELDLSEKDLVKNSLEKRFNRSFDIQFKVNPNLLGGFTIHTGTQFIDSSIRGALNEMRLKFKQSNNSSLV